MILVDVINGPNINILERRGPDYQNLSLKQIEKSCSVEAENLGIKVRFFQSNNEGELVSYIQESNSQGIVINPAGYTHTSVVLLDALLAFPNPKVEVHISNILAREQMRKQSITAPGVDGVICGFGLQSYVVALRLISSLTPN